MRWGQEALGASAQAETPAWHAEALMVTALFSTSRSGADHVLIEQAMAAVRAACAPVMVAASAANFAEVAAECGELVHSSYFADEAEATMRRHPVAAAALSWESVARARLAASELSAAEHAMRESLRLEEPLGCSDVNGDPWLSCAEVMLVRGDPQGALAMLEHPRRGERAAISSWTHTRGLRVRAHVPAALHRWEEAYQRMVQYAAAYERTRSIEGGRTVAESSAAVAVDEERKRSRYFERLALADALTGCQTAATPNTGCPSTPAPEAATPTRRTTASAWPSPISITSSASTTPIRMMPATCCAPQTGASTKPSVLAAPR